MRRLIAFVLCCVALAAASAAVDPFRQAKTAIKTKKNLDEAESALVQLANAAETQRDKRARAFNMAAQVALRIHEVENEKMYLRKSPDSLRFFSSVLRMFQYVLQCDSVESTVNERGRQRVDFARQNRAMRDRNRRNLLQGGKWMMRSRRYAEAYSYLDVYCRADSAALAADTARARVACLAATCAYASGNMRGLLRYADTAMAVSADARRFLEYKAKAQLSLADTAGWMQSLAEGVRRYPSSTYFFLSLCDRLRAESRYAEAIDCSRYAINHCPDSIMYHYALCLTYRRMGDHDNCLDALSQLLMRDNHFAPAYLLRGACLMDKAADFEQAACTDTRHPDYRRNRERLLAIYREALVPAEIYRRMRPDDSPRWAPLLYRIYYTLNMGHELSEIESIMRGM